MHAVFGEESPDIELQVGNNAQGGRCFIGIGTVVRRVTVEELHHLALFKTLFIGLVHGAENPQFAHLEVRLQRFLIGPGMQLMQGAVHEEWRKVIVDKGRFL
jgi:hypothetical protein